MDNEIKSWLYDILNAIMEIVSSSRIMLRDNFLLPESISDLRLRLPNVLFSSFSSIPGWSSRYIMAFDKPRQISQQAISALRGRLIPGSL